MDSAASVSSSRGLPREKGRAGVTGLQPLLWGVTSQQWGQRGSGHAVGIWIRKQFREGIGSGGPWEPAVHQGGAGLAGSCVPATGRRGVGVKCPPRGLLVQHECSHIPHPEAETEQFLLFREADAHCCFWLKFLTHLLTSLNVQMSALCCALFEARISPTFVCVPWVVMTKEGGKNRNKTKAFIWGLRIAIRGE